MKKVLITDNDPTIEELCDNLCQEYEVNHTTQPVDFSTEQEWDLILYGTNEPGLARTC